jgi:tetratricopeptide (TPR) repeat protein
MRLTLLLVIIISITACKKSSNELPSEELSKLRNSPLNSELRELNDKLAAVTENSAKSEILSRIAEIHALKGNPRASVEAAEKSVALNGASYRSRYSLGKALLAMDRPGEAVVHLVNSLSINGNFSPAYFELGNSYYRLRDYNRAVTEYRKAASLDAANPEAWNNLGVLLARAGRAADALKSFEKAIQADAKFSPAYRNIGILYETKLRDRAKARAYYGKYLELKPGTHQHRIIQAWIRNLEG